MKKLLYNRYKFYINENEKYIFEDLNNIKLHKLFLSVIEKYKPPKHVNPIFIYEYNNLDEYDYNLIYVGYDKNNYLQYFYGKEFVNQRNIKRDDIIKKINNNITKYTNIIKSFLKNKANNEIYIFACILLLELNFFIRTGKSEYETVGLLTLKNKNIKVNKDNIEISFVGKKQVNHKFILDSKNSTYKYILKLIKHKAINLEPNDKFFDISEKSFYNIMQENFDGVRLKDFRTYGVNKIFIENLKNLKKIESTSKKTLSNILEVTANIIGHTKGICKSSYLSKYLYDKLSLLTTDELINIIKKLKESNDPLEYIFFELEN